MGVYLVDPSILMEKAKVVSKDNNNYYKTNLKFRGISVCTNSDDDKNISNLDADFKFIKAKLKVIIEREFEKLYHQGIDNYNMDVNSVKDLIKLAGNPDYIYYTNFSNKKIGTFELYFNNERSNKNFFKNHTVIITIDIKDNSQLGSIETSIEG